MFQKITQALRRNKTGKKNSNNITELLKTYEEGHFPCSQCSETYEIKAFPPLSLTNCTKCNAGNFNPMKIKKYWLYKPLGGGGMGSVYKAFSAESPKDNFAVKILPADEASNQVFIDLLCNEAKVTAQFFNHPASSKAVEYGFSNNEYYFVLDFINGIRLDQLIDQYECLPENKIVKYMLDLLSIEDYIIKKGYLYRDLKPQNIFINKDDNLILYDYGLCVTLEQAAKEEEEGVEGSPHYLPPERILGEAEDVRSEIYSMGMMMFQALSGQTYFKGKNAQEIAEKHVNPIRLGNLHSKLPKASDEMVNLIDKMIKKDPEKRYQSFQEVETVLRYLHNKYFNKNYETIVAL